MVFDCKYLILSGGPLALAMGAQSNCRLRLSGTEVLDSDRPAKPASGDAIAQYYPIKIAGGVEYHRQRHPKLIIAPLTPSSPQAPPPSKIVKRRILLIKPIYPAPAKPAHNTQTTAHSSPPDRAPGSPAHHQARPSRYCKPAPHAAPIRIKLEHHNRRPLIPASL